MATNQDEAPSDFTEKIWGKEEGNVYITDGYTFRGKRTFNQAWEGLKNIMKKGVQNQIGAIKYKALDVRKMGKGIVADVEVVDNGNRGVGVLKLYGLNSKKEHVLTVTKSRESDNDHVVILTEKVVKPLMKNFMSDKTEEPSQLDSEDEQYKCNYCEKPPIHLLD